MNVHPTYKCDKGVTEKVKDPESCNRFIQCMDGLAYHFACQVQCDMILIDWWTMLEIFLCLYFDDDNEDNDSLS